MNIDKLLFETLGQEIKQLWPEIRELTSKYNDFANKLSEIKDIFEKHGFTIDYNGNLIEDKKHFFYKIADEVIKLVSSKTNVSILEIKNSHKKSRITSIKQARQIIYFFLIPIAKFYGKSQQEVSTYVAGQDHSTALHGRKTIFNLLSTNNEVILNLIVFDIIAELKKKSYLVDIIEQIEREIEKNKL
jgi:chromosomal replication initiation ATPase DnaA